MGGHQLDCVEDRLLRADTEQLDQVVALYNTDALPCVFDVIGIDFSPAETRGKLLLHCQQYCASSLPLMSACAAAAL